MLDFYIKKILAAQEEVHKALLTLLAEPPL